MSRFRNGILLLLSLTLPAHLAAGQNKVEGKSREEERSAFEKEFTGKLLDAELIGRYSITDGAGEKTSKPDRYKIDKVIKVKNDYWVFYYRKSPDVLLPIPLKVVWAGDTPMISMTNETIPALGEFSVRLMFYGDRYAGTWQHGDVGGHMWGRIEKRKRSAAGNQKDVPK